MLRFRGSGVTKPWMPLNCHPIRPSAFERNRGEGSGDSLAAMDGLRIRGRLLGNLDRQ